MVTTIEHLKMPRAEYLSHGEPKKQKQLLLTETAIQIIDEVGKKYNISRSETVERLARSPKLEEALESYAQGQANDSN